MQRRHLRRRLAGTVGVILLVGLGLMGLRLAVPGAVGGDPQQVLIAWASRGGWFAVAGYLAVFALLGAFGVPPALFIVPLGLLWGKPLAFGMALCGGMGAALTGFLVSRHVLRDRLALRIPRRFAHYERRLEAHGFGTVFMLRLLFFLFPPINWLLGLSAIPLRVYLAATLLGALPGMLFLTFSGTGMIPWLLNQPPLTMLAAVLAIAAAVGLWLRLVMAHPAHRPRR